MGRAGYDHVTQQDYESIAGPDWPTWLDFCQHNGVADFVYDEIDHMIQRPVQLDHAAFCVLPFAAREFWAGSSQAPGQAFCCLVPDGTDRDLVKKDMLAGRRPESCAACWRLEDQGLVSDRQIKNRGISADQMRRIQAADLMRHYKIDGNNTCNGTCVVCDSTYSTAWAQLLNRHGRPAGPAWRIRPETLDHQIDYATAETLGFRGGEPFLSDNTWHVLQRLLENRNTQCLVTFTTNGSIALTQEQRQLIARFPNVIFNFSIDGVGPVFEYVRYPLRWADLERNMQYCRSAQILITASYTISNLNILYHSQTKTWFENHGIDYSLNPVYSPSYFRPAALPESVKTLIKQQHPDPVASWLLGQHTQQDQADYELFRNKIIEQDRWKGVRMQDYLPELADLLG